MKFLKIFRKKKIKKSTNKPQNYFQINFYWELLEENKRLEEENKKLKKKLEERK